MKDVLMITHFTQVPGEIGNGRFVYLANLLKNENCQVEMVTTSFSHRTKKHRKVTKEQVEAVPYKLTLLHEPGYKRNVSLIRFYSHWVYGDSLKKYLQYRKKPDVIYCSVPSLDAAYHAASYARENNIRFIIDVQDLWPEAFKMVLHVPLLSNIVFAPMEKIVNRIYSQADEIIAVSRTYCERAMQVNKKCIKSNIVYLGTRLADFDSNASANAISDKHENEIWLAYCGTLGRSYDLTCVFDALEILKNKGISNLKFIVMGDGPRRAEFQAYSSQKNLNVTFTGQLPYDQMCGLLCACDITVNPITKSSAASIINKHADYAASGLPVLNNQESEEYFDLVEKYHMGFNCINGDAIDLGNKLKLLISDEKFRKDMGANARRCAEEKFDRDKSYHIITDLICMYSLR